MRTGPGSLDDITSSQAWAERGPEMPGQPSGRSLEGLSLPPRTSSAVLFLGKWEQGAQPPVAWARGVVTQSSFGDPLAPIPLDPSHSYARISASSSCWHCCPTPPSQSNFPEGCFSPRLESSSCD